MANVSIIGGTGLVVRVCLLLTLVNLKVTAASIRAQDGRYRELNNNQESWSCLNIVTILMTYLPTFRAPTSSTPSCRSPQSPTSTSSPVAPQPTSKPKTSSSLTQENSTVSSQPKVPKPGARTSAPSTPPPRSSSRPSPPRVLPQEGSTSSMLSSTMPTWTLQRLQRKREPRSTS